MTYFLRKGSLNACVVVVVLGEETFSKQSRATNRTCAICGIVLRAYSNQATTMLSWAQYL
jgi:hypothetical protein